MLKYSILAIMTFVSIHSFAMQELSSQHMATCTAEMSGLEMRLNIFKSRHQKSEGLAVQMILKDGQPVMDPFASRIEIVEPAVNSASYTIKMYQVLEPDVLFARFELPQILLNSKVDIYAITWGGKLWGSFTCN